MIDQNSIESIDQAILKKSQLMYCNKFENREEPPVNVEAYKVYAERMTSRGYIHSNETLLALKKYCQGYALVLSGSCGVGKTFFFQCLSQDILIVNANDIANYTYDEIIEFCNSYRDREIVIDDIGSSQEYSKNYGNVYSPLLTMCNQRILSKARTHFTTNLDSAGFSKFDNRLKDRIARLAVPCVFSCKNSYRTPIIYKH